MTRNQYVVKQVDQIARAISELSDYWVEMFEGEPSILDTGYPSDWPSFDEMAQDFRDWSGKIDEEQEEIEKNYNAWVESKNITSLHQVAVVDMDYIKRNPKETHCWMYNGGAIINIGFDGIYTAHYYDTCHSSRSLEEVEDRLFHDFCYPEGWRKE